MKCTPGCFRRTEPKEDRHTVLVEETEESSSMGLYKPKTQETRNTYAVLLDYIQEELGDQVAFSHFYSYFGFRSNALS